MRRVKRSRGRDARRGRSPAGVTRISAKNQATLPVAALRRAGLKAGDQVRVQAAGAGRIILVQARDAIERWRGCLSGVYGKGHLAHLRREWR